MYYHYTIAANVCRRAGRRIVRRIGHGRRSSGVGCRAVRNEVDQRRSERAFRMTMTRRRTRLLFDVRAVDCVHEVELLESIEMINTCQWNSSLSGANNERGRLISSSRK
jgi:hypothetical protein